jgi:outer membrane protein assembly factor BamB
MKTIPQVSIGICGIFNNESMKSCRILLIISLLIMFNSCNLNYVFDDYASKESPIVWEKAVNYWLYSQMFLNYNDLIITGYYENSGDYFVYAFSIHTRDTVWQNTFTPPHRFDPGLGHGAFIDKDKVILTDRSACYVLNANTGEIIWGKNLSDMQNNACVIDNYLYKSHNDFYGDNGASLYRFNMENGAEEKIFSLDKKYEKNCLTSYLMLPVLWRHPNGNEILVMHNRMCVSGDPFFKMDIMAWDLTADSMLWYVDSLDSYSGKHQPVISGNNVYFFGYHQVYCINPLNGELVWKNSVGDASNEDFVIENILLIEEKLIVKPANDYMYAININTGNLVWTNPNSHYYPSYLTVHQDSIWFSYDGIFAIDAKTGESLINWEYPEAMYRYNYPVIPHARNGMIFTIGKESLLCLDPKKMK